MYLVPSYKLMSKIFSLPSVENVTKASKNLIRLHNGHDHALANQGTLNCYSAQKVRQALNLYIPPDELLAPKLENEFIKAKSGS
tara:strand:- start:265 stop:516 length:252 start_codon:yes stop_codon:yes gene_type:complete